MPPPSALLGRLAAFLPAMKAANAELEAQHANDPASVSIEHLEDPHAQHIEMDLMCGLFEMQQQDQQLPDGLSTLKVPSAGTATVAMAAARKAGKTLVSEIDSSSCSAATDGAVDSAQALCHKSATRRLLAAGTETEQDERVSHRAQKPRTAR